MTLRFEQTQSRFNQKRAFRALFDGNGFNFEEINKTMDKIKAIEFLLFKFWLKRVMCSQFSHRKQSMLLG